MCFFMFFLVKKWTFKNGWNHFEVLHYELSAKFVIPPFNENFFETKIKNAQIPFYLDFNTCKRVSPSWNVPIYTIPALFHYSL